MNEWMNEWFLRIQQITAADKVGREADDFLLKVQQASAGHPWHMNSPSLVIVQWYMNSPLLVIVQWYMNSPPMVYCNNLQCISLFYNNANRYICSRQPCRGWRKYHQCVRVSDANSSVNKLLHIQPNASGTIHSDRHVLNLKAQSMDHMSFRSHWATVYYLQFNKQLLVFNGTFGDFYMPWCPYLIFPTPVAVK